MYNASHGSLRKEPLLESHWFSGLSFELYLFPIKSLCVLDYLDCEEEAGNFSFCAYCIPVVELPLEIILP